MENRLSVIEVVIGSSAEDGLRGMLSRMSDQISALTAAMNELKLAQAKATGAFEGATVLAKIMWAIGGGIAFQAISAALKAGLFGGP